MGKQFFIILRKLLGKQQQLKIFFQKKIVTTKIEKNAVNFKKSGVENEPLDLSSFTVFNSVPDFDKTVFIQFCLLRTPLIIDWNWMQELVEFGNNF